MRIAAMNWMQLERYLERDDRVALPLGSVEQHAYLSLATDAILAERVAVEAAAPLGVPVYPAVAYGLAPYFTAWPGTVTLREGSYAALLSDVVASMVRSGFRRIALVNGHGGNSGVAGRIRDEVNGAGAAEVRLHDWWRAPRTMAAIRDVDPDASHASWMENFAWTRLDGVEVPDRHKPHTAVGELLRRSPTDMRKALGDGSFGGWYARPAPVMERIWAVAVSETRAALEWPG